MTVSLYDDPRLPAVYDAFYPAGESDEFYLRLACQRASPVIDIGCGTGHLAIRLVELGLQAVGVDPSLKMLARARQRAGGDRVTWMHATAASFSTPTHFTTAIMTGNAFQTILTDDDILASLANIGQHLAPDGVFAFETRNPLVRAWENWLPAASFERMHVLELGDVSLYNDVAADGELVTYETHISFANGDQIVTTDTLRFTGHEQLMDLLRQAGFQSVTLLGDWDGQPFTENSDEIVVIAGGFEP